MTVRRLLEEIDSRELTEWLAFDKVGPPSESWRQTAQSNHVMAQLWSKRPPRYEDFLPARDLPRAPFDPRALRERLSHFRA